MIRSQPREALRVCLFAFVKVCKCFVEEDYKIDSRMFECFCFGNVLKVLLIRLVLVSLSIAFTLTMINDFPFFFPFFSFFFNDEREANTSHTTNLPGKEISREI
eukprot:TRINITY_DN8501_c0_g1_i4.p1 TRINITY_DN8501_c0_g1~~TRINITY_DN8501_c0_g1_i4.p1  ORF type:complete len:104 (-),score=4.84 TRINITY_DN8501_c0_g1_i4:83-394(-)